MGVRKCPKCGSVWYSALIKCAFCGVDGDEVKGPISPAKLNLGKRGVESGPPPGHSASDRDLAASAGPVAIDAPVATAEPKESAEPVKADAPPPPPMPEPPPTAAVEPPKVEVPPPIIEQPPPERMPEPPPAVVQTPVAHEAIARLKSRGSKPMNMKLDATDAVSAPAPAIPSSMVPLVFGALGLIASVLLPLTWFVQHDKIKMTFAVLAWAILAPFAPFAWLTAQRYADQCRTLGFVPAPAANTGKLLGMIACFLTVFEFSGLAVFIVVQILAGKIVCPLWK